MFRNIAGFLGEARCKPWRAADVAAGILEGRRHTSQRRMTLPYRIGHDAGMECDGQQRTVSEATCVSYL
jgi:hypothetical protein